MKKSLTYRQVIEDTRRVVVKIGSRVIVQRNGKPDTRRMRALAQQIAALHRAGREIVVVTSGAVGAGMEALHMGKRPTHMPDLQMAAAVGQCRLMSLYDAFFAAMGCRVGQVLLTHDDFRHKVRLTNAHRTMDNMLRHGVIPIVNENDVTANEEIRADQTISDNDHLAALLVKLIRADLLILLTTVDGVREPTTGSRTKRVRYIESITRKTFNLVAPPTAEADLSKGGMASKLKAAQAASKAGCSVVIANGRHANVIPAVMQGRCVGTMVLAQGL